jgi:hypothetical protein
LVVAVVERGELVLGEKARGRRALIAQEVAQRRVELGARVAAHQALMGDERRITPGLRGPARRVVSARSRAAFVGHAARARQQ